MATSSTGRGIQARRIAVGHQNVIVATARQQQRHGKADMACPQDGDGTAGRSWRLLVVLVVLWFSLTQCYGAVLSMCTKRRITC